MRLLVTGGAGYIGSVAVRVLLEAGHEVTVLDDLSTGHADSVPGTAELVQASLLDTAKVRAALEGCAGVLHFAAKSLVGESVAHPELYWRTNVGGSLSLLEAMRLEGVKSVVFSSTAATYGEPERTPILESDPTRPTNPYGASKLAVDHMLTSYAAAHGLGATSLRYFNVAGAYGEARERHRVETHLVPLALEAAAGLRTLTVYGEDYPTRDGTCVRDYIHVKDLVDAHLLALEASCPGEHQILNLGSGSGYTVREVLDAVETVTGQTVPVVVGERRKGDPAALVASNQKAAETLGWVPERTLQEMVHDAWRAIEG